MLLDLIFFVMALMLTRFDFLLTLGFLSLFVGLLLLLMLSLSKAFVKRPLEPSCSPSDDTVVGEADWLDGCWCRPREDGDVSKVVPAIGFINACPGGEAPLAVDSIGEGLTSEVASCRD